MEEQQPFPTSAEPPGRGDPYREYRSRPASAGSRFTVERFLWLLFGAAILGALGWLVWYFSTLIVYLLLGVLLAYILRPLVDRLQGGGLGRISAIVVTLVAVIGTISVLLTYLVPFMARQVSDLSQQVSFETVVQVTQVRSGSPAAQAGLRPGDEVVSVAGTPVEGVEALADALQNVEEGDTVQLIARRNGEQRVVTIPVEQVEDERAPPSVESLGVAVRPVMASETVVSIERRLRDVVPFMERGDLAGVVTSTFDTLFREDRLTQMASSVVGLFTDLFYAVLVIPFVMFFVLKDGKSIRRSMLRLVPNRYFEVTLAIIEKVETNLGRYFRGLLIQCVSIATVATILLSIVGLQYAVAVGIFTGLANTIPYFGPLMGFLAGTLVGIAQTGDFSLVLGVLVAMALTQVADNVFFQPIIFSRAAKAHPLIILLVVLVGAQLGGIVGMLVAIPLMTVIRVTVEQVLWSLRNYRTLQVS